MMVHDQLAALFAAVAFRQLAALFHGRKSKHNEPSDSVDEQLRFDSDRVD